MQSHIVHRGVVDLVFFRFSAGCLQVESLLKVIEFIQDPGGKPGSISPSVRYERPQTLKHGPSQIKCVHSHTHHDLVNTRVVT